MEYRDDLANPLRNLGELPDADAVGSVGNAGCGDLLRVWVKFKEEHGRKIIDKATFQTFGCDTAIAVASRAMDLIRGRTPEDALKVSAEEMSHELGPLPPTKIHCSELVEAAIRSALESSKPPSPVPPAEAPASGAGHLNESLSRPESRRLRIIIKPNSQTN